MQEILDILKRNSLRATPVRKQLLQIFLDADAALSNQDIEAKMSEADRVTLYRTLKSFQEKGIIHRAYDNTDVAKYATCSDHCDSHAHHDEHLHFHCSNCDNTFCVDEIPIPQLEMPTGFTAHSTNIVVEGICGQCA